jgi:hypothetical protein
MHSRTFLNVRVSSLQKPQTEETPAFFFALDIFGATLSQITSNTGGRSRQSTGRFRIKERLGSFPTRRVLWNARVVPLDSRPIARGERDSSFERVSYSWDA